MCGIAGYFGKPLQTEDRKQKLEILLRPIRRRGPDSEGLWNNSDGAVGFCHSRLSIIDLTPTGHQPMTSQCGNFTITFNGEIYNFRELKVSKKLRGRSDTEVLLELIAEKGIEYALSKIEGMFAFCIWNEREKSITLARDRLGEKPLYYAKSRNCFLFSSDSGSFLQHPDFDAGKSELAVSEYFRLGYVPHDLCIYENARKLLPGHFLTLTAVPQSINELKPLPFWSPNLPENFVNEPTESILKNLDGLFKQSVSEVMISDAPLGVFLSGGIDSSLVTSYAVKQSRAPIKTFSIGFREKDHDESIFAADIAKHLGTSHSTFTFNDKEIWEFARTMSEIYSEPFADSSQVATALLAREAKKEIKVALTGDGGDEIFFGYNRHKFLPQVLKWKDALPAWLSEGLVNFPKMEKIGKLAGFPQWEDKWSKIQKILHAPNLKEGYRAITSTDKKIEEYLRHSTLNVPERNYEKILRGLGASDFIRMSDIYEYLPGDVLTKVDRASMAFGLETRAPLLHPKIVSYSLSLSSTTHMKNGKLKFLLKEMLKREVPEQLWNRPKKGFSIPVAQWLRGPLKDWAASLLSANSLRDSQIFIPGAVEKIWDTFLKNPGSHGGHHTIWTILQFQAWQQSEKTRKF